MQTAVDRRGAEHLDRLIPLRGASHADVASYSVDIPMRYAECFATLADGRVTRLRNSRQFIGWSGEPDQRSFLFRSGLRRIEIRTTNEHAGSTWRHAKVEEIRTWLALVIGSIDLSIRPPELRGRIRASGFRKFIARDGSQLVTCRVFQFLARRLYQWRPVPSIDLVDPTGQGSLTRS